ncbi:MAG: FAD-dependent oxidoreductase [Acidimicrobiia bacterium]|nr:FAD-dependent oxidoreductase [Acidimicrobiia bacterium]
MTRRTLLTLSTAVPAIAAADRYDVAIYGATPAGLVAALAAVREGARVVLLEASRHIGGVVTGGLGATDKGNTAVIGGLALEFFERVGKMYGGPACWWFEPGVAMKVFREWLQEAGVRPVLGEALAQVRKQANRIEAIRTASGREVAAKVFVDASYEGDLIAQAGVSYIVGREGQRDFNESLAGRLEFSTWDQFWTIVNPYGDDGKLLPLIHPGDSGKPGEGDRKVQTYNFRLCLSNDRGNQVPFTEPPGYHPARFTLLARYLANPGRDLTLNHVIMLVKIPNNKLDVNNNGPISTDYLGASWDYPEGDGKRRGEIWEDHRRYTLGLLYFLARDPRVPRHLQEEMNTWGFAKDEFIDSGHFPPQLYVREARRMKGAYIMRQDDVHLTVGKPDSVGMGSYPIDTHHFQRIASPVGAVINEGFIVDRRTRPYQLPYRCLIPKPGECDNLLVPVCCSASHVAYSSIRLEPQYMILGHASGVAAAMCARTGTPVDRLEVPGLQERLREQRQILSLKSP